MKKGWTEVGLGDVVREANRFEAPQPGVSYRQLGVRLWGEGAYEREVIVGENTQYASFNRCDEGDLVVNKIWARNGSVSVVPKSLSGCFVSSEFPLYCLAESVLPGWLRLITKAPWFWSACDQKAQGTSGKNRIRPAKFLEIRVPLPLPAEQRRIVAHLDSIEERLIRLRKLRGEQELQLTAALRSAFHALESDAEWVKIEDVAPLDRRPIDTDLDGEYPELAARSFGKGIFHKPTLKGADLTWQKLFRIHKGDLVFSNIKAWEGAIAVATSADHGRFASHRYLTCAVDQERALPEFICFYLLSPDGLGKVGSASVGSADRNRTLSVKRLEKITVPIVPLKKQMEFKRLLDLRTLVQAEQLKARDHRDALLPSLLDSVFSG